MKRYLWSVIERSPSALLLYTLFRWRVRSLNGDLQSVHDRWALPGAHDRLAVDLGSGRSPANRFRAQRVVGLDVFTDESCSVVKCRLGFESLPFESNSVDYLTAYDLLEHIPRHATTPDIGFSPFIFLTNECYRVLKPGGIFLSATPIFPYPGAFQDPTHNNIMTADTFRLYFSDKRLGVSETYGIRCRFYILEQAMLGQHLVAVLRR